jgi:hypothetical protein
MTDKELLYQMLDREVKNIIDIAAPQFRMFSGTATNYIISLIDPYVDAFLSPADGSLNKRGGRSILKTRNK